MCDAPRIGPYFVVALAGLVLDLAIAWGLNAVLGLALPMAATCGFAAATVLNFGLNRIWTFVDRNVPLTLHGFLRHVVSVFVSLGVRLVCLVALQHALPAFLQHALIVLGLSAGLSFVVNYFLASRWVFSGAGRTGT